MIDTRLDVADLEFLADEATRQNRSLACLVKAMEAGERIDWCQEEERESSKRD